MTTGAAAPLLMGADFNLWSLLSLWSKPDQSTDVTTSLSDDNNSTILEAAETIEAVHRVEAFIEMES